MKMKLFTGMVALIMSVMIFASCSGGASSPPAPQAEENAIQFQYITKEDLKADIEGGNNEYIILDVRKAEDFNTRHIIGAFSGDVDSSINGEDDDTSIANLKAAIKEATGSEEGAADSKFALVCYSGKRYAEASTGFMIDMGIPAENIFTLEGGNNGWEEAGDDFINLMQ